MGGPSDEQVLAGAAEDAFSDARRSDSSRAVTRESKRRRAVNSHESLIAVYDPGASDVPRLCLTIVPLPQPRCYDVYILTAPVPAALH